MTYGSINNLMMARSATPTPEVGMGATELLWSDRHPYTITAISPKGNEFVVQEDKAVRTDRNGMSDSQSYEYSPNPDGPKRLVRFCPGDETWRIVEDLPELLRLDVDNAIGKRRGRARGHTVLVGHRSRYHYYSF